ncbi:TetR family transcriptional regulator [Frondihabitans sp. PhB188]|uniref:TetR/AcrR family transcriptional regulator n=1 Tax=Frondihabitans sp. PhB188 TaxID=2485200 RepID=UPI000F4927A5|nr:TetR/AcrR family transcriptional regulator [Frondihabitans sp. PhB188]ROQ40710.1 TetR family transcriptional regulator [Frondihabitans sp. PhB188]
MSHPSAVVEDASHRDALIRSADQLFTAGKITSTTIDDVDDLAELSRADFDAVFDGKDALIQAVLDHRHTTWTGHLLDAIAAPDDPRDKILTIFTYLESWFAEPTFQGCAFVNVYAELGPDIQWVADSAAHHKLVFSALVTRLTISAGMPASVGASIALLAEGAQVTAALTRSIAPAREARSAAALLMAVYQLDHDLPELPNFDT